MDYSASFVFILENGKITLITNITLLHNFRRDPDPSADGQDDELCLSNSVFKL